MTEHELVHIRLKNLGIADSEFKKPIEVVRHLGAVQAQDYPGTLWALGLRIPGSTEEDIKTAVASGSIVRTWPQRGTIHFIDPEEVHWRLMLTTPRIMRQAVRRHENLGLDEKAFQKAKQLFESTLDGGKQLTRQELMTLLEDSGISTKEQRGYHILWYWAQKGLIVFGAPQGKQQTFALTNDWAPHTDELSREQALAELTRSYFTSHGPATLHDLAYWSGLTLTEIKQGLEIVRGELTELECNGKSYWTRDVVPAKPGEVFLLPGFDEYMLGYRDRSAALDIQHAAKVAPGFNGVFTPTIVIDGKVEGLWKREIKSKHINISVTPFISFSVIQKKGIVKAFERYEQFMGLPVKLSW